MNPAARTVSILLAAVLLAGCSTVGAPEAKLKSETAALAGKLCGLSPSIDPQEAAMAAESAVRYPLELASEYRVTSPALFNNVLINSGLHHRGLCFQWADDLTVKLMTLHLRTLELRRGVARLGTRREHSCVVLTAHGQLFTEGIALDAWRHCGRLHWSTVNNDDYPWHEVSLVPSYQEELREAANKLEGKPGGGSSTKKGSP